MVTMLLFMCGCVEDKSHQSKYQNALLVSQRKFGLDWAKIPKDVMVCLIYNACRQGATVVEVGADRGCFDSFFSLFYLPFLRDPFIQYVIYPFNV